MDRVYASVAGAFFTLFAGIELLFFRGAPVPHSLAFLPAQNAFHWGLALTAGVAAFLLSERRLFVFIRSFGIGLGFVVILALLFPLLGRTSSGGVSLFFLVWYALFGLWGLRLGFSARP